MFIARTNIIINKILKNTKSLQSIFELNRNSKNIHRMSYYSFTSGSITFQHNKYIVKIENLELRYVMIVRKSKEPQDHVVNKCNEYKMRTYSIIQLLRVTHK